MRHDIAGLSEPLSAAIDDHRSLPGHRRRQAGFTLLEIIFVVGLIAFIFAIGVPNFNLATGSEVASRLGRLSEDVRAAFDYSVLTGKPVRLVFHLNSGRYWLEATDARNVTMGDEQVETDRSAAAEREQQAYFDEDFQRYSDLVGESIRNPNDDDADIVLLSPVIAAKEALRPPSWYRVDSLEWRQRDLGSFLIIRDMQAAHHARPITFEDGPDTIAMVYFLPQGYVESTVIHVYYRQGEGIDESQTPYTIRIHPHAGIAQVTSGLEDEF